MTRSDQVRTTQVASGPWVVLELSWEALKDGRLGSSLWPIGGPNKTKSFPKRQNYTSPLGLLSEFLLKGLGTWARLEGRSSSAATPLVPGPGLGEASPSPTEPGTRGVAAELD